MPGKHNRDASNPLPPFGELLREYRAQRGVTVEHLAEAIGFTPGALRDIESDKRAAPSIEVAGSLADLLNLHQSERKFFLDAAKMSSPTMRAILGRRETKPEHPALSAAILVFLIADIRGYTRFTQEHGDEAAARLTTRFAELAHRAVEQWDGHLIEVRGDEILAVFASARQALRAAQALQTCCAEETSAHEDLPLGVGIGLDVGEAVPVAGGGYRGAALNRAARLCSLAGPGEVLATTGVMYLAPQVDGMTFVARGQEQLKGFAAPTPIVLAAPSSAPQPVTDS